MSKNIRKNMLLESVLVVILQDSNSLIMVQSWHYRRLFRQLQQSSTCELSPVTGTQNFLVTLMEYSEVYGKFVLTVLRSIYITFEFVQLKS